MVIEWNESECGYCLYSSCGKWSIVPVFSGAGKPIRYKLLRINEETKEMVSVFSHRTSTKEECRLFAQKAPVKTREQIYKDYDKLQAYISTGYSKYVSMNTLLDLQRDAEIARDNELRQNGFSPPQSIHR